MLGVSDKLLNTALIALDIPSEKFITPSPKPSNPKSAHIKVLFVPGLIPMAS